MCILGHSLLLRTGRRASNRAMYGGVICDVSGLGSELVHIVNSLIRHYTEWARSLSSSLCVGSIFSRTR